MSLAASPPPGPPQRDYDAMNDQLDEEINSLRSEIQALTQRRKIFSSTLLGSTAVQSQVKNQIQSDADGLPEDITPLLADSQQHAETNVHRLAFGVTAFPFTDPNPETSNTRLIGIRIDICNRDGKFGKPYYLLCQRVEDGGNDLRLYRHTIPVFINLKDYEKQYLPLQDEGYASEQSVDGNAAPKQDLHTFVRKVRQDLVSWALRRDAIDQVRDDLEISSEKETDTEMVDIEDEERLQQPNEQSGKFGVRSIEAVSEEARFAKIVWKDGRVGRIKISDEGMVERAVVFGDQGRLKNVERVLTERTVSIKDFSEELERLDREG